MPKGTWHGLNNTGKELLVFTFGYSPAGFEDFFRQIGTLKNVPFKAKTKEEFKFLPLNMESYTNKVILVVCLIK